ncbi:glycosyltransferase family 2 protein [Lactarius deliciosus]|nr:glycosyltransferase family 2 protein [Lactarius deliciosus]
MDYQGQRPPRAHRPSYSQYPQQPQAPNSPPSYIDRPASPYSPYNQTPPQSYEAGRSANNVSFQNTERGDRRAPLDQPGRVRQHSAYQNVSSLPSPDPETGYTMADAALVGRKKSLVRPDREKIEPGHRQWHYRSHAARLEDANANLVRPSTTGNAPHRAPLRRGRSLLGREEDVHESGLALFKRGTTLRRKRQVPTDVEEPPSRRRGCLGNIPGPHDGWVTYCYLLTVCVPPFLLRSCGIRSPEQQRAWREKMGLISLIVLLMAGVGFLTFGFTEVVCGTPPNRFHAGFIDKASVIIHGYDYDFSHFAHPKVGNFDGRSNPLFEGNWNAAGNDISFLFQNTNGPCQGIITKASNSTISGNNGQLDWYFPCNIYNQQGTSGANFSGYESNTNCHLSSTARSQLAKLSPMGQVYYSWNDVKNSNRNLAVYESTVLDFGLLKWLSKGEVNYPAIFDQFANPNGTFNGKDISMFMERTKQQTLGHCLQNTIGVGFIDTNSIGCVASDVVLYVSLIFIVGVVAIRFIMAVMFAWFFAHRLGMSKHETYEQRIQRMAEIENWTNDIYRPAPSQYRPNVSKNGSTPHKKEKKGILPRQSRFTPSDNVIKGVGARPNTSYGAPDAIPYKRGTTSVYGAPSVSGKGNKLTADALYRDSRSSTSLNDPRGFTDVVCPFPLNNVVPQPAPGFEPFGFPLAHTICLVTAYSDHKLILVIADGVVKGAGNDKTTPEICLSMMKEFVIEPEDVEAHSYVAIADGHKRHNMAKVYAGFYDYDDHTVEKSKQQRVPVVLVAKTGNPLEATDAKPGNRGKRDSQIVLMSFLQKVMFDERMTTFEYEFFNSLWRVTGVSPDRYELVLCVDADTKVFPDSLTRMASCMVQDEEIMGLCGETKIANKGETWVTMIQVFEYYISHHMTKAFESMFGGVTCLPGCFSMYRIKAPKGASGYWVPILANPDIVEHYSENVVDTLHKKNLLLLGEDRYLTTLMLKTFPKRKNLFLPSAVCKTVVPDTFRVLLSQRRRWINSTVHNLAELVLVRDLCGTFCFSMQFVVGMELAGTLVLPAAISFTLYLIISTIVPGGPNTTIPLALLAIILGLPGLLIVITTRKIAYVGWMLTRQVSGDKGGNHGDKEGEFDSTNIVMKRWAEFERERRWKNGVYSRDSTYYDPKANSPRRYSTVSNTDTCTADSFANPSAPRPRLDSQQLLTLPAPLALNRPLAGGSSTSVARSNEDVFSDNASSHQRLVSSPTSTATEHQAEEYHGASAAASQRRPSPGRGNHDHHNVRVTGGHGTIRQATAPISFPIETANPFQTGHGDYYGVEHDVTHTVSSPTSGGQPRSRGISLSDKGPVPPEGGVRRVSRPPQRRPTSQTPQQNRYSRPSSIYATLPPGAAPPNPNNGQYGRPEN